MSIEKYPLRILFWEATLRCNAHCAFCGSSCGDEPSRDELTSQEIRETFRRIAHKQAPTQVMINVTGGEPLVREDLFDVMAYASSLGFHWGLVTNGMRLTPPAVRALKESGCQTASISIDGCAETHDRLRGVPGGLERVLEGIRLLKREDFLETLMISTTVSRQNLHELPQIKTLLAALPIDAWRISAVDSIGRADDDTSLLLSKDQMDELFRFIAACRNEPLPYVVMTSCSHYLGRYEFRVRDVPFQCMTGKTVGSILANGDIYVCPDVPRVPEHIQGNVRQDDFMDVWNSGFKFFRERENRRAGICARCRIFSNCAGDCTHTWDFEKNEPKFCPLTYGLVDPKAPPDVDTAIFAELIARVKKGNSLLSGAVVRSQSLAKDRVILSPGASRDIFSIFRKDTDYEQLGVLCGQIYLDREQDEEAFLVFVEKILELTPAYTSPALMLPGMDAPAKAAEKLRTAGVDLRVVGFVHSHPGELGIAMSSGDYLWHRQLYQEDWKQALSVIINPQKRMLAAYAGPEANHVELHLLGYTGNEE